MFTAPVCRREKVEVSAKVAVAAQTLFEAVATIVAENEADLAVAEDFRRFAQEIACARLALPGLPNKNGREEGDRVK